MKKLRKLVCVILSLAMIMPQLPASANDQTTVNLAQGKTATASAEYSTMPASNAVDGKDTTRWSSEAGPEQWLMVDLGEESTITGFRVAAENTEAQKIGQFKIEGSNDGEAYTTIYQSEDKSEEGFALSYEVDLTEEVTYRYVKITIQKLMTGAYPSVSLREFEVLGYEATNENLAYGKTAVASSEEAASVTAANATDGDTTSRSSRWGSGRGDGPHWIYVDLGEVKDVKVVRIFWENRKATAYKIEMSNTAEEGSWTAVKTFQERPSQLKDTIVFDTVQKARYIRLYVDSFTAKDPDSDGTWNTVSIYEMEVYSKEIVEPVQDEITVDTPAKGDKKLNVHIPERKGYTITYNGTDYEQVVDRDLTIYEPIVDTTVKVSFKIVNDQDHTDYSFEEIEVTIPGTYTKEAGDNQAPVILPELTEWKGLTGNFVVSDSTRIVIADDQLKEMADVFAADYQDMTGKQISVVTGEPKNGDFYFSLTTDQTKGLQDEGYLMEIGDVVSVEAETTTGAFWGTRTILQALKSGDGVIPKGITRDYPLYEVRGYILDVGRKTFTMDQLQQIVKQMSWYKMNDFQIHLNDNLIPLENYSSSNKDPMTAYSAFRLESDIKEGGNGGLNQADLTSTDVFYTKDEFRSLIKTSRIYGVNIVPEIDTPAHSLALTKVRPDLRHGTWGRNNDHLNLTTKYEESLSFVQSIFDEYMGDDLENPVFDELTTVHVGADEYSADGNAYRRFCNDMLAYVQDSGRTARIWGSLSSIQGDVTVTSENVQMNLWNFGWANMDKMYEEGFDLINCNDGNYYIVPNAGYYYDYLNPSTMYNLDINSIGGVTIPAGDEQMIGGAFAIWNDMTDYLDNGVSEYDVYKRFDDSLGLFAAKLWGKGSMSLKEAQNVCDVMGDAPNTNFGYEVEADQNGIIAQYTSETLSTLEKVNAAVEKVDYTEAVKLNGGKSYVTTDLETVGLENSLRVKVKRISDSKEDQILFESPYGSIKAVQGETGKVGITRENFDYSFQYELPVNEWVELEFKNEFEQISLYVNGVLVDTLGDGEMIQGRPMLATCMLPVAKIGSESNAFIGYVADVRIGQANDYVSTMDLDYAVWLAETLLKTTDHAQLKELVAQAQDVIHSFQTSAEIAQKLTDDINNIIKTMDYDVADYGRVEAYLAQVPEEIRTYFTAESVQALEMAIDSIQYGLPKASQDRVDGYEMALARALEQLELKTASNVNYVDNDRLTATASSYQDGSAAPEKAIDNDTTTMWHQKWADTTSRHWIDLKLDQAEAVNGITYVPRSGGGNGNLQEYTIAISKDNGQTYEDIKSGSLTNNADTKVIEFDSVEVTNVRIYFDKAVGGNASAAEIKLHAANVAPDLVGLTQVIEKAEAIVKGDYTEDSWNALQTALTDAKALVTNASADPETVESTKRTLAQNMTALTLNDVEYASEEQLDELRTFVNGSLEEEKYKAEDVQEYKALQQSVKTALTYQLTAKEAAAWLEEIQTFMAALKPIEQPEVPDQQEKPVATEEDKAKAEIYLEECKDFYVREDFQTEEEWKAYQDALTALETMLAQEGLTKEELRAALKNLDAVIPEKADTEPDIPTIEEPDVNEPDDPENQEQDSVQTGDATPVMMWIVMFAMAAVVLAMKKKENR